MPAHKQEWPERYGFFIHGNGPTFVTHVEPYSISAKAGICTGDCIVQLDNQDVSKLPAETLKQIALNARKKPPSITVQGVSHRILLNNKISRNHNSFYDTYGFSLKGDRPVYIDYINESSIAFKSGMRPGDFLIEVNSVPVTDLQTCLSTFNKQKNDTTEIKYVSLTNSVLKPTVRNKSLPADLNRKQPPPSILLKPHQSLYSRLDHILGDEPTKHAQVLKVINEYTDTNDVIKYVTSLNIILVSYDERKLIEDLRGIVGDEHQDLFDTLMKHNEMVKEVSEKTKTASRRSSIVVYGKKDSSVDKEPVYGEFRRKGSFKDAPPHCTGHNVTSIVVNNVNNEPNKIPPGKRYLKIYSSPYETNGITLKKGKPPVVSSVEKNSPAQLSGLHENDILLFINDLNVEEKSIEEINKLLHQNRNLNLEVIQKSEYEKLLSSLETNPTESLHLDSFNRDTFKQKVKEVLDKKESSTLKRILINYNETKNVDKFLEKTNILLNTESKRVLWFYLEKILDEFHKPIVHEPVEITSTIRSTKSPSYRLLNKLVPKKDIYASHNFLDKSNELQTVSRMNSLINSRKFRSTPSLNTFHSTQAGEMMFKLSKQLDYFLNEYDRDCVKSALEVYENDRKIYEFVESVNKVLDTPAKRTLWFHLIPLLDEDDQDFCKRKLKLSGFNFLQERSNYDLNKLDNYDRIDDEVYILTDTEIDTLFVLNRQPLIGDEPAGLAKPSTKRRKSRRDRSVHQHDFKNRYSCSSIPIHFMQDNRDTSAGQWFEGESNRDQRMSQLVSTQKYLPKSSDEDGICSYEQLSDYYMP